MGCDIHSISQKKVGEDWVNLDFCPFDWRQYGMYGFLADVRNYSDVTPISPPKGLPDGLTSDGECDLGEHSFSWISVRDLADFDYDAKMEDRRVTRQLAPNFWSGAETCEPGQGVNQTYREFLGEDFFADLAMLQQIGAERIVFGFDS